MLRRLVLMMSLVVLFPSLSYGAEVQHVPAGWIAPAQGYYLTEPAGRDVLSALQSRRQTGEAWERAYGDLRTEFLTATDEMRAQLKAIENNLNAERQAWRAEIRKARSEKWLWMIGAAAVGYAAGR